MITELIVAGLSALCGALYSTAIVVTGKLQSKLSHVTVIAVDIVTTLFVCAAIFVIALTFTDGKINFYSIAATLLPIAIILFVNYSRNLQ